MVDSGIGISTPNIELENYWKEKEVLQRKIEDPRVPSGKKEKCLFRLNDINTRLLPKIVK